MDELPERDILTPAEQRPRLREVLPGLITDVRRLPDAPVDVDVEEAWSDGFAWWRAGTATHRASHPSHGHVVHASWSGRFGGESAWLEVGWTRRA